MSENKGIKISPKFYQKDWRDLKLNSNIDEDWNKAIEIFKDRMEGRFIKQIEVLDRNPNREIGLYAGFSIMPLICLFIETLEQFWTGNIETKRYGQQNKCRFLPKWINNKSKPAIANDAKAFYSFFQRNTEFANFFDTEEKADVFYRKIRCGLLHQGQTKGKSLIHIRNTEPMLQWINSYDYNEGISIRWNRSYR